MTSVVLPRPDYLVQGASIDLKAELLSTPEFMEVVERSMQARLEGRMQPWSQVKKELDIR